MGEKLLVVVVFFLGQDRQAETERDGERNSTFFSFLFRTRLAGRDRDKEINSTFVVVFQDKTGKKKLVKAETKDSAAVYRWCFQRKR